jgi:hypothetical protein
VSREVQALITILKQAPTAQSWPVAVDTWFSYCDAAEMSLLFQELLQLEVPLDEGSQAAWGKLLEQFIERQRRPSVPATADAAPEYDELPERQDLIELYSFLGTESRIRHQILLLLAMRADDASTEAVVSLLINEPPLEVAGFAIALSPYLQRDTNWDLLFPALFQALRHPIAAAAVLDLANYLCRNSKLTPHAATPISTQLVQLLTGVVEQLSMIEDGSIMKQDAALTAPEIAEQVNQGVSLAVSLCDALALVGDPKLSSAVFQAMNLGHRRVQVEAAAALIKLEQDAGRQRLVTLAEEPAIRIRVLKYAEELSVIDQVDVQYTTPTARAEGELALYLAQPHIMGLPPARLELYDETEMYWPGFAEQQTCFLFRYEYLLGDEPLMNIAIATPEVQSVTADLTHCSPEDIYALFAAEGVTHDEIFEMDATDLESQAEVDSVRLQRRAHDRGYEQIQPLQLGFFFGDHVLSAAATREGVAGIVVVDAADDVWFAQQGSQRPLTAQDAYNIYKGRKLLATFNPESASESNSDDSV